MIDASDDINNDTDAGYTAFMPSACHIKVANDNFGTRSVYKTLTVFVAALKSATKSKKHLNTKLHVGTILLGHLISYTNHHVVA